MHFMEIIKLQFEKLFHELHLKNAWLPQFSFWISITLVKIYISYIIINVGKNIFELVGTVLKHTY